jgi:FkbM family methyltransferase
MNIIDRYLSLIEKTISIVRGKGWGSSTVELEFSKSFKLLSTKNIDIIFDIGANHGKYIDAALKKSKPTTQIYAFEPSSHNIDILKSKYPNAKINPNTSETSSLNIFDFAISNKKGNSTLHSDKLGSGLASIIERDLSHFNMNHNNILQEVKTITIDEIMKEYEINHIDILKMDIEGNELNALHGATFAFENNLVNVCQFEFGGANIDSRTYFRDFWNFFNKYSYSLFRISPIGLIEIEKYTEDLEHFRTTNYIAKSPI